MKALLIGINSKYIHPAMALYQLKANTTYPTDIIEYTIKQDTSFIINSIFDTLNTNEYRLIGFSTYLWNIEKTLQIIKVVRQNFPNIKILCGGPETGFDAKFFLTNNKEIDYIISGEGEDSFHELLEFLDEKRELKTVSNLCYLEKNTYIKNEFKYPNLSKIKLATLDIPDLENRIIYLESGRGCPYKCSYCTASLDNKVRFFPLKNVIDIVKTLMEKKVKIVKFLDRTFNANMKYMSDILKFIDQYNICTSFQFEIVVEKFNEEIINEIANLKKKFLRFEIGIQSTNDIVNEAVCRRQNMELLEKNLLLLNATNKVDLHVDLIAGLPFETKDSFIISFNRVFNYQAKELQLGFLKFLRGTALLDTLDEHEYKYSNTPPYEIIENKYMNKEELSEIHEVEHALDTYYNSGKFIKTFKYLIKNKLIDNPFCFLHELSKNMNKDSLYNLFTHIDKYFKKIFDQYIYNELHFLLIQDYLDHHKTKPKLWYEFNITREERKLLYEYIISKISLSIDTLYKNSIVYYDNNLKKIYICIYKNYNIETYLIYIE